jgi:uncharacterized protein with PQ loop repeat
MAFISSFLSCLLSLASLASSPSVLRSKNTLSISPKILLLSVLAYLCHPFYLTEGEIEGEKASIRQPKVMLMLAYGYKQA